MLLTQIYFTVCFSFLFQQKPRCNGPLNGPLVIILCAGSKSVDNTFKDCLRLVNGIENGPRVEKASGLGLNIRDLVSNEVHMV